MRLIKAQESSTYKLCIGEREQLVLFEGSEKKVEVTIARAEGSLRDLPQSFWSGIVEKSEAQILSSVSSEACDAYLLSESSLFVWDHHFTMITCGQTRLVNAVLEFVKNKSPEVIESLIFERKNEYFPRHQKTDFYDDIEKLNQVFSGQAFRFGQADGHHLFLYHLDRPFAPSRNDYTAEILMYDLQGRGKEVFGKEGQTSAQIRQATGVDRILEGFTVDDFVFSPRGYSLNALKGRHYFTIHVTPEETGSYVSFETNIELQDGLGPLVEKVVGIFEPNSYDLVLFSPFAIQASHRLRDFYLKSKVKQTLSCGYEVNFLSFFKEASIVQPATHLSQTS